MARRSVVQESIQFGPKQNRRTHMRKYQKYEKDPEICVDALELSVGGVLHATGVFHMVFICVCKPWICSFGVYIHVMTTVIVLLRFLVVSCHTMCVTSFALA